MAGFNFGEWLFGKPAEVKTKEIEDTTKTAVSGPLSSFLSSKVGQGLPRYSKPLYSELDPNAVSRYQEFIGIDAPSFFQEKVAGPAISRFTEDLMPTIREGFAGGLRGSGRIGTELQAINKFASDLASQQGQFELALPAAQFEMASKRKAQMDAQYQAEYQNWFKSLPENNPILGRAMEFLGVPSGKDTLAWMDPGQKGGLSDIAGIATDLALAYFSGGTSVAAGGVPANSAFGNVDYGASQAFWGM